LSQRKEVRLVLYADGTRRLVPLDELNATVAEASAVGSVQQGPLPAESPTVVESSPPQPSGGIRPGDIVTTPFGEGTVISVNPGAGAPYHVDIPGKSTYFLQSSEVTLRGPKA